MISLHNRISDTHLLVFSLVLLILLLSLTSLHFQECFVLTYQIFTLFRFLNNLGHTICILDFLTFYSAFDTLSTPLLSYSYFNASESLTVLWGRVMAVNKEEYFNFLIPANIALFIGVHLIFYKNRNNASEYVRKAKEFVSNKLSVGIGLIVIGVLANIFSRFVPQSLAFVFYLLSMLAYIGMFYFYFAAKRRRLFSLLILTVLFFFTSIQKGLFGEFLMFMTVASCLIMAQYKISFFIKLLFLCVSFWVILIIQSVKGDYRQVTWNKKNVGAVSFKGQSNLEIFFYFANKKIQNPATLITDEALFFMNYRFNQGWLIARVMNYIPVKEPYANGETIFTSLAAVAVPRFLWPDKPESGGASNLSRFVGIKKKLSYSMNIGPFGEAYGNFGLVGGVFFIFFYGLTLAYFLHRVLEISMYYPSVIIWIPLLFYYTLTVETDLLSTLNSFIKISLFVYLLYWLFKRIYKVNI